MRGAMQSFYDTIILSIKQEQILPPVTARVEQNRFHCSLPFFASMGDRKLLLEHCGWKSEEK